MMKLIPGTLRARLVLLIILATMPSLAMLFVYVWQAQERSILQTGQQAQTAIEILAASQKELILRTKLYLQRLSGFDELQTPASPACSDFLRKALRLRDAYVNLAVPLPNGDLQCTALPMSGRVNVADQIHFQQSLRSREFAIGEFQIDRATHQASMSFSYPVLDPLSKAVKGVAVAVISLDWWSRKLAEVDLPDGAVAIVTDANHTIIAHHPANSRAIGQFAETYGFALISSQQGAQHSTQRVKRADAQTPMIHVHRALFPAPGHPSITVSIGLPYGEAIAASNQYFWRGVTVIFLGVAFVLALTTWAIRESVIKPLNNLLSYTQSLERGSPAPAPKLQGAVELMSLQTQIVSMGETRLAAESELRESEARFRQIAETIDEVFWVVSPDWNQVNYVNQAYEQVWQKSADSLYREPRSWIDAVVPEDRLGVLEYINQVASSADADIVFPVFRIERRDGTVRWISAKGFAVYNEEGEVAKVVAIAEDVTERMQYEAELSEREAKYRLLVEHAEDLVVKVDTQGRFLFVSPSYCKAFGKSEHQLLGKAFMPMVHEEDQAATEAAMKALYYPPFITYLEQRAMTLRGWRWYGWSDTSVLDDAGKVIEIIGVGRDITGQKHAEFALRESESRYRELVENMSDGVVVYQPEHESGGFIIKEINQAAERIACCKREEILGHDVNEIFPGVSQLGLLDVFKRVADGGEPVHHPVTQYQDQRIAIWVENYVFRLPSGEVVAVFKDLTAEKQALDALQTSEEKFRGFFEKLPVGLVIADTAGQVIDINDSFDQILGIDRSAAVGRSLLQLLAPTHDRASLDLLQDVLQGREGHCRFQVNQTTRDNRQMTANVSLGVLLNRRQERVFIYGIIEDVTALVETEAARSILQRELARSYRLEALGRLAGGIAHDFNNILGAIAGFIELALARVDGAEPQRISNYLKHSLESAERAKQLIRQLLLFSRGPEVQLATPQDFAQVVEHALKMTRSLLPSSIEFEVDIQGGPYKVNCDPAQIEQVLINLCINARDAMAEKGRISVAVGSYVATGEHCEICPQTIVGQWVSLSVSDSGSGIEEMAKDKIFEPFFTTKGREKGTGLGLSVVRGIVSSYRGHILLSSDAGNGTCFRLLFPFYTGVEPGADETKADAAGRVQPVNLSGLKAMVVDDELSIRQLFQEALSRAGCDVRVCSDSEEALRQLLEADQDFDLLVTDQTMPHMTGMELIRRLREAGSKLPVILCSGYSQLLSDEVIDKLQIARFLEKPVKIQELLAVIQEVVVQATKSDR